MPKQRQLWSTGDVCREYDITRAGLAHWRRHRYFPKAQETAAGPIWEAAAIRRWEKRYRGGRRRGPVPNAEHKDNR
jgi:hypothetical protein